jgi:hypothetical protein
VPSAWTFCLFKEFKPSPVIFAGTEIFPMSLSIENQIHAGFCKKNHCQTNSNREYLLTAADGVFPDSESD